MNYIGPVEFSYPNDTSRAELEGDGFHVSGDHAYCRCPAAVDCVLLHPSCYGVFLRSSAIDKFEATKRLWVIATWKHPWKLSPPLYLPRKNLDRDALQVVAARCGISQLAALPSEIVQIIRANSEPYDCDQCSFWNIVAAVSLANQVSVKEDSEPLQTVRLSRILSWERGGKLQRIGIESRSQYKAVRVTIDGDGISRVEALPEVPLYSGECYDTLSFAVLSIEAAESVVAHAMVFDILPNDHPSLFVSYSSSSMVVSASSSPILPIIQQYGTLPHLLTSSSANHLRPGPSLPQSLSPSN